MIPVECDDQGLLICPVCQKDPPYMHLSDWNIKNESVELEYWCENCHGVSVMNLEQDKGHTWLSWEPGKRTAKEIFDEQSC
tara:strand:+ start:50 stop:292 length:243 start_codon:yes stop_codon:yes gene_type:complete